MSPDYFAQAAQTARTFRDQVVRDFAPACRVGLTVIGPDNVTRVPCGEATFPRAQADVFAAGILTITSRDDDSILREYAPGQWTEATVYGFHGDIDYCLLPHSPANRERHSA